MSDVTWPVFMQSRNGAGGGEGSASARECVFFVIRLGRGQYRVQTGMFSDSSKNTVILH